MPPLEQTPKDSEGGLPPEDETPPLLDSNYAPIPPSLQPPDRPLRKLSIEPTDARGLTHSFAPEHRPLAISQVTRDYLVRNRLVPANLLTELRPEQADGLIRRHKARLARLTVVKILATLGLLLAALTALYYAWLQLDKGRTRNPLPAGSTSSESPVPATEPEADGGTPGQPATATVEPQEPPPSPRYQFVPGELTHRLGAAPDLLVITEPTADLRRLLAEKNGILKDLVAGEGQRVLLPAAEIEETALGQATAADSASLIPGGNAGAEPELVNLQLKYRNYFRSVPPDNPEPALETILRRISGDIRHARNRAPEAGPVNSGAIAWLQRMETSVRNLITRAAARRTEDPISRWTRFELRDAPTLLALVDAHTTAVIPIEPGIEFTIEAEPFLPVMRARLGSRTVLIDLSREDSLFGSLERINGDRAPTP